MKDDSGKDYGKQINKLADQATSREKDERALQGRNERQIMRQSTKGKNREGRMTENKRIYERKKQGRINDRE